MNESRLPKSPDPEEQIAEWRSLLAQQPTLSRADADELEDHLRSQMADLRQLGLTPDEAFLVAVKRVGRMDALADEFAVEHSDRLWKQLVLPPEAERPDRTDWSGLAWAIAFAVGAALAIKLFDLIGPGFESIAGGRNVGLLVTPFLAGFLAWKRRLRAVQVVSIAALFAVAALAANLFPFATDSSTGLLVALAVPVWAWFCVGVAYANDWRSPTRRMDFVRFTGEWVIYYSLIASGGGALVLLTGAAFGSIGIEIFELLGAWVIPAGAAGAVVIAAYLVEAKQSVVENMAPVLTKVFTPLTTLMLIALVVAMIATGAGNHTNRELLIISDLLLVLVLGLLLYSWSARDQAQPAGPFDSLQLVLVGSAIAADLLGLIAMITRISTFGSSPNKWAALLLNLLLLVNLSWAARLLFGFVRGRLRFEALTRWQLAYLPAFAGFALVVIVVFPPLFGFA